MSRPLIRQALRLQRARQVAQIRFSSRYSQPATASRTAYSSAALAFDSPSRSTDSAPPATPIHSNPYIKDSEAERLKEREKALTRIRYASVGLFFSVLGLGITSYVLLDAMQDEANKKRLQLDASSEANAKFQGREVHTIGIGEDKRIIAEGGQETELVETGTSSVPYFPKAIYLPLTSTGPSAQPNTPANPGNLRNDEEYTLVGLGIRSVSFLSIQVYVMGLYVRTTDLTALQARLVHHINPSASTLIPTEKDALRKALLDPQLSTTVWETLLRDTHIKSAWRIVPTRNTDFAHLRDGWITGITRGTQAAKAQALALAAGPAETEYESEAFGAAVKAFRDIFASSGGRAPKGSVMTLVMDQRGGMDVLFEDAKANKDKDAAPGKLQERLGGVADPRVARLIWMGYLAGKNVSSEAARTGVAEGCLTLAARPVGSAETMVT